MTTTSTEAQTTTTTENDQKTLVQETVAEISQPIALDQQPSSTVPMETTPSTDAESMMPPTKISTNTGTTNETLHSMEDAPTTDFLLDQTLYCYTNGIPRLELSGMIQEAEECEEAFQQEIAVLEKAIKSGTTLSDEEQQLLEAILQTPFTPLDRCWTLSALLGRLRAEWMLPSVLPAMEGRVENTGSYAAPLPDCPAASQLRTMMASPNYTLQHDDATQLLATWKKLALHRTSIVFKRPVKPEEAPGYTDRIPFPMDLSMIRKLIVARHITTYEQLHQYVILIAHDCVKYNGRESDYGNVAREFEAASEEIIRQAIQQDLTSSVAAAPNTDTADNAQPDAQVDSSLQ